MECPIAVKRCTCRNSDCQHEFQAKEKNWERVKQRGVISPTHEREKLEYRVGVKLMFFGGLFCWC